VQLPNIKPAQETKCSTKTIEMGQQKRKKEHVANKANSTNNNKQDNNINEGP
jgi:hypothetical protein